MVMSLMSNPKGTVATVIVSQAGDGDTTDIQTGINMLPAAGGCVYIKEGTYTITQVITIPNDNISIIGCGRSTLITSNLAINIIDFGGNDNIHVEKIFIQSTDVAGNGVGMFIFSCENIKLVDCWIEDMRRDGIYIEEGTVIIMDGNFVSGCLEGIGLYGTNSGIIIKGNSLKTCRGSGIHDEGADGTIIENNVIQNNIGYGIKWDSHNSIINANYISGNDSGTTGNFDGINIAGGEDRNIITNNQCRDNGGWGIDITNVECLNNLIAGNIVVGNGTGEIRDGGTNTIVSNNIES